MSIIIDYLFYDTLNTFLSMAILASNAGLQECTWFTDYDPLSDVIYLF